MTTCSLGPGFIAGRGVQFLKRDRPIWEEDPFDPKGPYAVARISAVYAARYFRSLGFLVYIGYLFHHESPRRKPEQISRQIAAATAGRKRVSVMAKVLRRRGNFMLEYRLLVSSPRQIITIGWRPKTTFPELAALMVRSEKVQN